MPRTTAQNEWRRNHKPIVARIELTASTKIDWQAYADSMGLPLSTMIRRCIARCMEQDGWQSAAEEEE